MIRELLEAIQEAKCISEKELGSNFEESLIEHWEEYVENDLVELALTAETDFELLGLYADKDCKHFYAVVNLYAYNARTDDVDSYIAIVRGDVKTKIIDKFVYCEDDVNFDKKKVQKLVSEFDEIKKLKV